MPVFLPGVARPPAPPLPPFLASRQEVDWRDESPEAVDKIVAIVRGDRPRTPPPPSDICPYRGLKPFGPMERRYYFGRDEQTANLVERLRDGQRLLAVVGASGCGKSSLVLAGLVPALLGRQLDGRFAWRVARMRPGKSPCGALAEALVKSGFPMWEVPDEQVVRVGKDVEELSGQLLANPGRLEIDLGVRLKDGEAMLIVVDQLEELFTLTESDADRDAFLQNLLDALDMSHGALHVVLTLRADFLGLALRQPRLMERLPKALQIALPPMDEDQLRAAILGPAEGERLQIDSEVVRALIEKLKGRPADLPLLQYALTELWRKRRDGQIDLASLDAIGGLEGAIAQRAEAEFAGLDPAEKRACERLFGVLIHMGEGSEDTRRLASWDEVDALGVSRETGCLKKFVDARLVTTSAAGVEMGHEALLAGWPRLTDWLEANRGAVPVLLVFLHQLPHLRVRRRQALLLGWSPNHPEGTCLDYRPLTRLCTDLVVVGAQE